MHLCTCVSEGGDEEGAASETPSLQRSPNGTLFFPLLLLRISIVMAMHGNAEEANSARPIQYSVSDIIIAFTPASTSFSYSSLSHAHTYTNERDI